MAEISQNKCPNCGGDLTAVNEYSLKCPYCGDVFDTRTVQKQAESLQAFLDQAKIDCVNNLRRNLYDAIRAKYVSSNEVRQYATDIKKLVPDDFQANFYLEALSDDVKRINELIRGIDAQEHYEFLAPVVYFLIGRLEGEFILELNALIERAYMRRNPAQYSRFATALSEEAEKVLDGIYETSLPRDVFIAYSSKDMRTVSLLCEELEDQGFSCFVAARNLRHGVGSVENYDKALREAMDNCTCFLFVSTVNSRRFDCDAVRKEIPHVKESDKSNAPGEFRNNYRTMPAKYKKPRIEYRVGDMKRSATDALTNEFFDGFEWVYDTEGVIARLAEILTEMPPEVCIHVEIVDPAIEPTCETNGRTEGSHCALCGEILKPSSVIPAKGHRFGDWRITKPATCIEDGIRERVCDCGKRETATFPAHGVHRPGEWQILTPATQYAEGLKIKKCTVCGAKTDEETIPVLPAARTTANPASAPAPSESAEELYNTGEQYYNDKNYKKAVECFTKAAVQGHATAQCNLGVCYEDGTGVVKDEKKAAEWYSKAAVQGLASAQHNLGVCYENGTGITKDERKAAEWYTKAALQGHPKAQFNLGVCYEFGKGVTKDEKKAVEWFTKAAEQGNATAQFGLGFCYENGTGVTRNEKIAVEWYTKAAVQGDSDAQYNLGVCYEGGTGVTKDEKKAVEWFTKAAVQGLASAQYNLGVCYEKGTGITKDEKIAVEWYTKAAKQGDADAQKALERLRASSQETNATTPSENAKKLYNTGLQYYNDKNYKKAVKYFTKAALQGYATAQSNLGVCYEKGTGITKDEKIAVKWYTKAAEQGHATAQCNLGVCYALGKGVTKDEKKAVECFIKAALQGHVNAQFGLGVCYYNGTGVTKDEKKAAEWFTKAAEQGHANAQEALERLRASSQETNATTPSENAEELYNTGLQYYNAKNYEKAVECFAKAAVQGYADAQCNLGYCYAFGKGVTKDEKKAVEWYSKAAEQGHANAQFNLGVCYEGGTGVAKDEKKAMEWYTKAAEQGHANAKKAWETFLWRDIFHVTFSQGLAYQVTSPGRACTIAGIGTCTDKDVIIPEEIDGHRVTSIGDSAFKDCSSPVSMLIPNSVLSIGTYAFSGCRSLKNVNISNSVTSIGAGAFFHCASLASVTIPDSVTSIGAGTFRICTSLVRVVIGKSVTHIGKYMFEACTSLTSVHIPDSVTSIRDGAFAGCTRLEEITYAGTKKQWKQISLDKEWRKNSAIRKVNCADGAVNFHF